MDSQNQAGTWRTIKRLEKSIPQVRWYRGELMLMSLFINLFALGLPIFILQVYDRILPNLGLTTMQFLVIGLVIVMILDFVLKTIRAAVTTYTGARFEHLARVAAVDKILRTPQDVYEQETPGAYLDKVNAIGVVKEFYSSQLGTLFIDLPFAIFFLGMIWFLGGLMVVVPLTLLALFGIMAIVVGGNLRRAVDVRGQVDNRRYDFLIEIINGIHTVKAQAFKNLLQRRFESMQETSARAVRSVAMQSSIAQSLGSTFGQLNMACVIGMGAVLVIDGNLSAGELAACTLLSGRAMQPLQSAMGLWTNFQTIRVACDNATSVMELPAEDLGSKPEMPRISGEIEFRDVSFRYAEMDHPFIENLNLKFKAGSMIGIEGDNSSGRSTLLKLMIGIIRPTSGQVMIDGHDLAQHQSHSYREQMAFLSADADVYTGTILDNMTYFRGGKYIKKAIDLAKKLGLDEEIKRLPEGYGTHIGDGAGGVLPAGFAQRITIVRAMVDGPKIVLFDNANHGLDSNTDKILLEYISSLRGKATVILVSARPSWLRAADKRYVMSGGQVLPKQEDTPPQIEKPVAALPAPEPKPAPQSPSQPERKPDNAPVAKKETSPTQPAEAEQSAAPRPAPKAAAIPRQKAPAARPRPNPKQNEQKPSNPTGQTRPAARPEPSTTTNDTTAAANGQAPKPSPQKSNPGKPTAPATPIRTASGPASPAARPLVDRKPVNRPPVARTPVSRTNDAAASSKPAQSNSAPRIQQAPTKRPAAPRKDEQRTNPAKRRPIARPTASPSKRAERPAALPEKRTPEKQTPQPSATSQQPRTAAGPAPRTQNAAPNRPKATPPRPVANRPVQRPPATRPAPTNEPASKQTQKPAAAQPAARQATVSEQPRTTKPAASQPDRQAPKPQTRPAARPVANNQQQRPTRPAPNTSVNNQQQPPANPRPAEPPAEQPQPNNRAQTTPPRPAATLRPAAATGANRTATGVRPQPPKPRRVNPRDAGFGGAE